jgi:hypothetical protein
MRGNSFQQRGFACAVFPCKKTDSASNIDFIEVADDWNRERISVPVLNTVAQQCDFLQQSSAFENRTRKGLQVVPTILSGSTLVGDPVWFTNAGRVGDGVGADKKPQDVTLIHPLGSTAKLMESTFMHQTYQPAICDGKAVRGTLLMDF